MENGSQKIKIAIVGLGYVGLPLATEFAKVFDVIGFDINKERIQQLNDGYDTTNEVDVADLSNSSIEFTFNAEDLRTCNVYIVTVPTPIKESNIPDLEPLKSASELISKLLCKGDLVVYESTVYPGVTEEICANILESGSNLFVNEDFGLGYSPERINPGDQDRKLSDIKKITSGSNEYFSNYVDTLYSKIIKAGTVPVSSIKIAEASKVIENIQRDINIAFVNELAKLFYKLDIPIEEVLNAAGTKWNFLKFQPGLVGGHCIGVDPYYLTHKAAEIGHHPEIILAGRRTNDTMANYVVNKLVKEMLKRGAVSTNKILICGATFKENCPDVRNSKVFDVKQQLEDYGFAVDVHDPHADPKAVLSEYNTELVDDEYQKKYDGVLILVSHNFYKKISKADLEAKLASDAGVIYDFKGIYPNSWGYLRY